MEKKIVAREGREKNSWKQNQQTIVRCGQYRCRCPQQYSSILRKIGKCWKVELPQWSSVPEEFGNLVQPLVEQVGRNHDQRALGWQEVSTVHLRQCNHFESVHFSVLGLLYLVIFEIF